MKVKIWGGLTKSSIVIIDESNKHIDFKDFSIFTKPLTDKLFIKIDLDSYTNSQVTAEVVEVDLRKRGF